MGLTFNRPDEIERAINSLGSFPKIRNPKLFLFHYTVPSPTIELPSKLHRMRRFFGKRYSHLTVMPDNEYRGTSLDQAVAMQYIESITEHIITLPFVVLDPVGREITMFKDTIVSNESLYDMRDEEEHIKILCDLNQVELNIVNVRNIDGDRQKDGILIH